MTIAKRIIQGLPLLAVLGVCLQIGWWAFHPNDSPSWTGFGSHTTNENQEAAKTLWDWLDLLLVPFLLGAGAWIISQGEKAIDRRRERDRFEQENLAKYLEFMSALFIEGELDQLSKISKRSVARTQSLRIVRAISPERKGEVLQFLYESGMLYANPVIDLLGATFADGDFTNISLKQADIRGVTFQNGVLVNAQLDQANFTGVIFSKADLSDARVDETNFTQAKFIGTTMKNVDLRTANLKQTDFSKANLKGSWVTAEQYKRLSRQGLKKMPAIKK